MKNRLGTFILTRLVAVICFVSYLGTHAQESVTNKVPPADQAGTNHVRELTNSKPKHLSEVRASGETANHAYEQQLVDVVLAKWKELQREPRFYYSLEPKEITATFRLHPDGSVSDINLSGDTNSVADLLCWRSINDCAPFPKWPEKMHPNAGKDYREVKLIFYANQKPDKPPP